MKRRFLTAAMILSMNGCAYFQPQTPIAKMAQKYTVITGVLVAPVELKNGNHRMIVYFNEGPEVVVDKDKLMRDANGEIVTDTDGKIVKAPETPKAASKNVLMCVAANESHKEVLVNLREYLNDPKAQGKTIFIYGTHLQGGAWMEYLSGVHCSITAIGFYIPTTGAYTYVMTEFGDGVWDNFSWTEFLKKVGSAAVDKAL